MKEAAEVPKMTGIHEAALRMTIIRMEDGGESDYTGGIREVLDVVSALASGRLRTYSPETEVVVPRAKVDRLHKYLVWLRDRDSVLPPCTLHELVAEVAGWLAVPAAEGGETDG